VPTSAQYTSDTTNVWAEDPLVQFLTAKFHEILGCEVLRNKILSNFVFRETSGTNLVTTIPKSQL
jgi:hypothetical protein